MRELKRRLGALEDAVADARPAHWCRVYQHEDQTQEEALAAWEAEHGPTGDRNLILRVIIRSPLVAAGRSAGAIMHLPS